MTSKASFAKWDRETDRIQAMHDCSLNERVHTVGFFDQGGVGVCVSTCPSCTIMTAALFEQVFGESPATRTLAEAARPIVPAGESGGPA